MTQLVIIRSKPGTLLTVDGGVIDEIMAPDPTGGAALSDRALGFVMDMYGALGSLDPGHVDLLRHSVHSELSLRLGQSRPSSYSIPPFLPEVVAPIIESAQRVIGMQGF